MKKLTNEQKEKIELEHNVYVDAETGQYNCEGYKAEYGWNLIPTHWLYAYAVRDREAGNIIEKFETKEAAEKALQDYETQDKTEGTFVENFYEVAELE